MYICVTHVDDATKIPGFKEPMRRGPSFPLVKGLKIEWWDESRWPILHPDDFPRFYGSCDDDADTSIEGVIEVLTEEQYNELKQIEEFNRIPFLVTPRQARLSLIKHGVYEDVINVLNNLEEPLKSAALVEWEFALEINRHSPLVKIVSDQLGWTKDFVSELFITASGINIRDFTDTEEEIDRSHDPRL